MIDARLPLLVGLLLAIPSAAYAQSPRAQPQRVTPEARIDAILALPEALHAGLGIMFNTGTYLRSGVVAGVGASRDGLSGRIDGVARFHLDPFREHRWAPYGGGGLTIRFDEDRRRRPYLLLLAGIDGPVKGGLTTSFEAALGGGGRIGVIIRRGAAERR
ncbi:MAG: hypothetical protein ABI681_10055 [Gemmatimonadales bacterium]